MSQMLDPTQMGAPPPDAGAPPDPGMGAPPPPDMGAPPPDAGGAPPGLEGGGGLPPELAAALSGGGGQNSSDMLAEGPMAGQDTETADEQATDDPLALVRDAISILRKAGDLESDDQRSHLIDKVQADLQKILATESQKTDKLRAALGG